MQFLKHGSTSAQRVTDTAMAEFDVFEHCAALDVAMVVVGAAATTTPTVDICADLTIVGDVAVGAMPHLTAVGGNLLVCGDAAAGASAKLTTVGGTVTVTGVRSEGAFPALARL